MTNRLSSVPSGHVVLNWSVGSVTSAQNLVDVVETDKWLTCVRLTDSLHVERCIKTRKTRSLLSLPPS